MAVLHYVFLTAKYDSYINLYIIETLRFKDVSHWFFCFEPYIPAKSAMQKLYKTITTHILLQPGGYVANPGVCADP